MALVKGKGHLEIVEKRRWDNYASLKQYFKNSKTKEIMYHGHQVTTASFAELHSAEGTFAVPAANGYVYCRSEADAAALDGDSIYFEYCDSSGNIYTGCEGFMDKLSDTSIELPYGYDISAASGYRYDTVAGVAGDALTMTGLNSASANDLAGLTVLGLTGDQAGNTLTVASNTAASPTVITCTTTPNANWAADTVCVGTFPATFFRLRRMWAETESPTDNRQYLCNIDGSALYGQIQDGETHSSFSRYFAPIATTCKSYLGKVHCSFPNVQADAEIEGAQVSITFTPAAYASTEASGTSADITVYIPVQGEVTWEPCIELRAATDVVFQIKKNLDADHVEMFVETAILEVYV